MSRNIWALPLVLVCFFVLVRTEGFCLPVLAQIATTVWSSAACRNAPEREPEFRKDGELTFLDAGSGSAVQTIDIEIADDTSSREQGLMYRRKLGASQGMLFVYQNAGMRSFWMKETHVPLDIIFVGSDHTINTIVEDTTPLSEEELNSREPSQYVVEVNAFYCATMGIEVGDSISFKDSR